MVSDKLHILLKGYRRETDTRRRQLGSDIYKLEVIAKVTMSDPQTSLSQVNTSPIYSEVVKFVD